jgi:putative transposase
VKQSIIHADAAYARFFKHQSGFPKFKKKNNSDVKMYFVKTDAKSTIWCQRHRIKIPTLGWVKIKEKGYLPPTKSGYTIRSGTVSIESRKILCFYFGGNSRCKTRCKRGKQYK